MLVGPFLWKKIEQNLELFLFINGVAAATVAGVWRWYLVQEALEEPVIKGIVPAVLVAGLIFHYGKDRIRGGILRILRRIPLRGFVFLMVVGLGLVSSVITAIIAALLLVEITCVLPLDRRRKIELVIISCFSIGLGAVLTPLGEPLSTIAIAALDGAPYHAGFFFLLIHLGLYVVPGLFVFGAIAALLVGHPRPRLLERLLLMKPLSTPPPGTSEAAPATSVKASTSPGGKKPSLLLVRTTDGKEKEAAAEIAGRAELRHARVWSVFIPEGMPGRVVVEADDAEEVNALLQGTRHSKAMAKSGPEVSGLMGSRILESDPPEGELVEIVKGPFSDQTGKVVQAKGPDGVILVELQESRVVIPVREDDAPGGDQPAGPDPPGGESCEVSPENISEVFLRAGKVYLFVMALILLGGGMKVIIDKYFVLVPSEGLYWVNIVSAVLDNATLTAAEIAPALSLDQIKSALMGLLIAGGILIPGNIPNIIAAHKLKIGSREWASLGVPLGLAAMLVYFLWLYLIPFP